MNGVSSVGMQGVARGHLCNAKVPLHRDKLRGRG